MDSIPVLQTVAVGDSTYLHGEIHVDAAAAAAQEPKYLVVIVDDNSGRCGRSKIAFSISISNDIVLILG